VAIAGLQALSAQDHAHVTSRLPLEEGAVFRSGELESARSLVAQRLRELGHARPRVEATADVFPERDEAELRLQVEPGPVFYYGDIEVAGLLTVPAGKVREIVRRDLPRGARFSPKAMEDAQADAYELRVFGSVRVTLAPGAERSPAEAPVRVLVSELPAHSFALGGGVALERNLFQVQLEADYTNVNSLGGASVLSWSNTLALTFVPTALSRVRQAGLSGQSVLQLTVPEVLARTDVAARVAYERLFYQAFETNVLEARLGLPLHLATRLELVPSVSYARYLGCSPGTPVGSVPPRYSPDCPGLCQELFPEVALTWDGRDDVLSPRRGFLGIARVRYGVPLGRQPLHFLRLEPEARLYWPVHPSLTLAARARLGLLYDFGGGGGTPIVARFFGGGSGGHRGFGPQQLSPFIAATDGELVPVGGAGEWLATLELRARLSKEWGLVAFADYGDVTDLPLRFGTGKLAVGLGPRFYSPAGPIRVDLAWRPHINPRIAVNTGESVEGNWLGYFAFQFGLGEAF